MDANAREREVKFFIADLSALEAHLQQLGAREVQPRTHEINLRFDTPEQELSRGYRVLRLRRDQQARLTYKGPSEYRGGVRDRQEIEFSVSDFDAAQAFLEALGYQVSMMYEKYRSTYELDGVEIVLDEMPYGMFAELEGPTAESIQSVNQRLGLNWEARVPGSYTAIFDQLRQRLGLTFRDLSFANFADLSIDAGDLEVYPADQP